MKDDKTPFGNTDFGFTFGCATMIFAIAACIAAAGYLFSVVSK